MQYISDSLHHLTFSSPFMNYHHCQYPKNCSVTCVYYSRKRLCIFKMEACYCVRQGYFCANRRTDSFVYSHEIKLWPIVSCILISHWLTWGLHIGTLSYVKQVEFCKQMELFLGKHLQIFSEYFVSNFFFGGLQIRLDIPRLLKDRGSSLF